MQLTRTYLYIVRRTAWWNVFVFYVFFALGANLPHGALNRGALDPLAMFFVTAAIVFGGAITLLNYLDSFRGDSHRILHVLPIRRAHVDTGIWAIYVLVAPLIATAWLYTGAQMHKNSMSPWLADAMVFEFGLACIAIHGTFYAAATISHDVAIRIACVGACAFILISPIFTLRPYLPSLPAATAWCAAAIMVSYFRKSEMRNISPAHAEVLAEGLGREIDAAAILNTVADAKPTQRQTSPPPLPMSRSLRTKGHSETETKHRSLVISSTMRARLFGLSMVSMLLVISILGSFTWMSSDARSPATSGTPNPTGLTFGFACAAVGLSLSLERKRAPVYRLLPLSAGSRCIYAWLVGAIPCLLVFLVATPFLLSTYNQPPMRILKGLLLSAAVATHLVAGILPGAKKFEPALGQSSVLHRAYLITKQVLFVLMIYFVLIVATSDAYWSNASLIFGLALASTSALHLYTYHYRMRGI